MSTHKSGKVKAILDMTSTCFDLVNAHDEAFGEIDSVRGVLDSAETLVKKAKEMMEQEEREGEG